MRFSARVLHLAVVLATLAAACGGDEASEMTLDTALARDLALANVVAVQPELNDAPLDESAQPAVVDPPSPPARVTTRREVAPRPRPRAEPRREQPAPSPRPEAPQPRAENPASTPLSTPAPSPGFVAGTRLAVSTHDRVCTVSGRPGDKIVATLRDDVRGTSGAMIPAGTTIVLEVASVEPGDPAESGRINFRVRSLDVNETAYPAHGSGAAQGNLDRAQVPRVNASDRKKVVTGVIAGAILGRILGGDTRGAVIGAAAGGAAGAAKARSDQVFEGCLAAGSPVAIVLDEGLTLS